MFFFKSVPQPFDPKKTDDEPVILNFNMIEGVVSEDDIWVVRFISQNIRKSRDVFSKGSIQYLETYKPEQYNSRKRDVNAELEHNAYKLWDGENQSSKGFDICFIKKKWIKPSP